MYDEMIKLISNQGVWAMFSFFLICYILKTQQLRDEKQEEREKNYQNIILQLTEKLNTLDTINSTICELKNKFK